MARPLRVNFSWMTVRSVEMVQVDRTYDHTRQNKVANGKGCVCFLVSVEGNMKGQRNRCELIYRGRGRPWYTHKKRTCCMNPTLGVPGT